MKVRDPEGKTWRVTRRWVPWRRRVKVSADGGPDLPDGSGLGDDPISALIGIVLLIILLPFLLLGLVALLELLLLLAVMPFAVLVRMLFGRHWHVEVREGFSPYHEVEAGDWRASTLKIHELAAQLERGERPVPNLAEA